MKVMKTWVTAFSILLLIFFHGRSSVSAASSPAAAKMVSVFFTDAFSALLDCAWSLKSTGKKAVAVRRPMMRFESGYTVETVFDGSKLGIEPYSVEVSPSGELLVLDSVNSNIYRIPPSHLTYSRPKLVAGSAEGYSGHVDGKSREARMNHPKGFAVDDRGNIYVADTMNRAIRKITDLGVSTIAGGKWSRRGHSDGPSEDAELSGDFDVVYIGSSCSLLVIDRGSQAIREIQLHFDDCAYQYGSSFPLGIGVLFAAAFLGYLLALLQRRVGFMGSPKINIGEENEKDTTPAKPTFRQSAHQRQPKPSSFGNNLFNSASSFLLDLFGDGSSNRPSQYPMKTWPVQDSYVVPNEDVPPPVETRNRTPTSRKPYAFTSKYPKSIRQTGFNDLDGDLLHKQPHEQQHLQQQRHYPSEPETLYEKSCETTKEIVFGAVQESAATAMEIKAVDYGFPIYGHSGFLHPRVGYGPYGGGYYNSY